MAGENWTFWLLTMNYALGLTTLAALLSVAGTVGWDLLGKRVRKLREIEGMDAELHGMFAEPRRLVRPELGPTMADGWEKTAPSKSEDSNKRPPRN
jgi:hypothetical protein